MPKYRVHYNIQGYEDLECADEYEAKTLVISGIAVRGPIDLRDGSVNITGVRALPEDE